jgi:hypothetical protein
MQGESHAQQQEGILDLLEAWIFKLLCQELDLLMASWLSISSLLENPANTACVLVRNLLNGMVLSLLEWSVLRKASASLMWMPCCLCHHNELGEPESPANPLVSVSWV